MINTLVSGFYMPYTAPAIEKLNKDGIIDLKLWIYGDSQASECIHYENKVWWWDIVFGPWYNMETSLSEEQQNYLFPKFHLFEQQLVREKLFELDSAYEIRNIIFKLIYYFKHQIEANQIQLLLLTDVPHGAYDYLLYHVAKMMGVRVLFTMPSFWTDMTFIYESLEEIGLLGDAKGEVAIEEKFEKDIEFFKSDAFYNQFKPTIKSQLSKYSEKYASISHIVSERKDRKEKRANMYNGLYDSILLHLHRAFKRVREKKAFRCCYRTYFRDEIHSDEKFVYFPLHLQPEMTVDTLGGEYYDQLLALEKLRKILPDEWYIYVKENPIQFEYMRGKRFYERLMSIENIRCLSKKVNTYDLIRGCEFVATINGSAGWEAISGGKQVLYFGNPWYKHMDGVSKYFDGICVEDIMIKSIDHKKIEEQIFALQSRTYPFYVEAYFRGLSKHNDEVNVVNLFTGLKKKIMEG